MVKILAAELVTDHTPHEHSLSGAQPPAASSLVTRELTPSNTPIAS